MTLQEILIEKIKKSGPMRLDEYMALCLSHPEHGYYMKKDPFGAKGDFTTAPEISQIFGEMVGLWCAVTWQSMGAPKKINLMELGPGRGTLMQDVLRATKNVPGFLDSVFITMVETSHTLRKIQEENLQNAKVKINWAEKIKFPKEPFIIIANEFLDALPIRQFEKTSSGWQERYVEIKNGKFIFILSEARAGVEIPQKFKDANIGSIYEYSATAEEIFSDICKKLQIQISAALFIDYGYIRLSLGDSFQALKKNKYHDVLETPGDADLTTHVNFSSLVEIANVADVNVFGPIEQGKFLTNMGIETRVEMLKKFAPASMKQELDQALKRLTSQKEMGALFKVIAITSRHLEISEGFGS